MKRIRYVLLSIAHLWVILGVAQSYPYQTSILFFGDNAGKTKIVAMELDTSEGVEVDAITYEFIQLSFESQLHLLNALEITSVNIQSLTLKSGMPVDFPIMPRNPTAVQEDEYKIRKNQWIEDNSKRYEILQQPTEILIIPLEEFNLMPSDKQDIILNHSDLYSVQ